MQPKKNPKHNLEKQKSLFLSIGFAFSLIVVLTALEWRSYETTSDLGEITVEDVDEEDMPITEREVKKKPPPPSMEELVIVADEEEIKEELEITDMDIDEGDSVVIVEEEEEIAEEEIFMIVEQMPKFRGGDADLLNYLAKNIKYPQMARESGITGTVTVTFVVRKTGKVEEVKVLRGIGGGCDKEAVRVVKTMPDWKPGKQRGKPVSVQFNLPVRFVLR